MKTIGDYVLEYMVRHDGWIMGGTLANIISQRTGHKQYTVERVCRMLCEEGVEMLERSYVKVFFRGMTTYPVRFRITKKGKKLSKKSIMSPFKTNQHGKV